MYSSRFKPNEQCEGTLRHSFTCAFNVLVSCDAFSTIQNCNKSVFLSYSGNIEIKNISKATGKFIQCVLYVKYVKRLVGELL